VEGSTVARARYLDLPYRIILTKEGRQGGQTWVALVEELPGCEARGDSAEQATEALREVMAEWFAAALEEGRGIPRPRNKLSAANGRLSLEIPQSLHEALTHAAVREGLSLDQLVTIALAGVIRWRPGDDVPNGQWIEARAKGLTAMDGGPRPGLRRAIIWNASLLGLVAVAAVALVIVAVVHGF
jgi:predicted RNase H-like HicB family nuclease